MICKLLFVKNNRYKRCYNRTLTYMSPYIWQKKALNDYHEKNATTRLKKLAIVLVYKTVLKRMQWKENKNYVDCGVFCMRHMGTYKGKKTTGVYDALLKQTKKNPKVM